MDLDITYFPVLTSRETSHHAQVLGLHPFMLGRLADATVLALHGGATTDGFLRVLVQTVQRTVRATRWGDGGGLLGTLGRAQSSRDIKRALRRAQLARLQWELVQGRRGETRRGRRIIGGGSSIGVGGRWMTVNRDLVGGIGSGGGHNVSSHLGWLWLSVCGGEKGE